jgi:hypothetical protein
MIFVPIFALLLSFVLGVGFCRREEGKERLGKR